MQIPVDFYVDQTDTKSIQAVDELFEITNSLRDTGFEYLVNCSRFPQILTQIRYFEDTLLNGYISKLSINGQNPEAFSTGSILTIT